MRHNNIKEDHCENCSEKQKPFEVAPTKPTYHEKSRYWQRERRNRQTKRSSKPVSPTGEITPGRHAKHQDLFSSLAKQEELDIEDA